MILSAVILSAFWRLFPMACASMSLIMMLLHNLWSLLREIKGLSSLWLYSNIMICFNKFVIICICIFLLRILKLYKCFNCIRYVNTIMTMLWHEPCIWLLQNFGYWLETSLSSSPFGRLQWLLSLADVVHLKC